MSEQPVPSQTATAETPRSPTDLPPPDWKESARRAAKEFKEDRGTMAAAGMAFYWFLALFPAIIAGVGILGLVNAAASTVDDITKAIRTALPGSAATVLTDALRGAVDRPRGSSLVATVVGLGVALWSASAGMVALQAGCNVAYDVREDRRFVPKRGVAFLLVVVTALLAGVATTFIVFGEPLGDALRDNLPFGGAFVVLWTLLRWAVGLAALVLLFACIYSIAPYRETPRWTWLTPGGVFATAGWLLASLAFSFYVSHVGSYAETYGSLTGVVVLLLWLYLSALAVVAGAELNAELERQGEHRREERRRSRGPRRAARAADTSTPETTRPSVLARLTSRRRDVGGETRPLPTGAPSSTDPPHRAPTAQPTPPSPASPPEAADDGAGPSYQDEWLSYGRRGGNDTR